MENRKPVKYTNECYLDDTEEERKQKGRMFENIIKVVPEWKDIGLESYCDFEMKRLNGNSNACYKVELKERIKTDDEVARTVFYRRYEQKVVDKRVEQAIFQAQAEEERGEKLYFQDDEFRVEGFFHGRPLSLWEMRNPMIFENYARLICQFNFSSLA